MGYQMKLNLSIVRDALEGADSDPNKSLFFYNNPRARMEFFKQALWFSVEQEGITDPANMDRRADEILMWLDKNFQQYGWAAHEVHFHTNFYQHCACPFTCLNEISSILEKLIKEKFAA